MSTMSISRLVQARVGRFPQIEKPEQVYPFMEGLDPKNVGGVSNSLDAMWATGELFDGTDSFFLLNSLAVGSILSENIRPLLKRVSKDDKDSDSRLRAYTGELSKLSSSEKINLKEKSIIVTQILDLLVLGVDPLVHLKEINFVASKGGNRNEIKRAMFDLQSAWFAAKAILTLDSETSVNELELRQNVWIYRWDSEINAASEVNRDRAIIDGLMSKSLIFSLPPTTKTSEFTLSGEKLALAATVIHDHMLEREHGSPRILGKRDLAEIREVVLISTLPRYGDMMSLDFELTPKHESLVKGLKDEAWFPLTEKYEMRKKEALKALSQIRLRRFYMPKPGSPDLGKWSRQIYRELV